MRKLSGLWKKNLKKKYIKCDVFFEFLTDSEGSHDSKPGLWVKHRRRESRDVNPLHTITFLVNISQRTCLCFILLCKCLPCALLTTDPAMRKKSPIIPANLRPKPGFSSLDVSASTALTSPWNQGSLWLNEVCRCVSGFPFNHFTLNRCWDGAEVRSRLV